MPLYEYRCRDCGYQFEILQRLGQGPEGLACARCGAEDLAKQFSTFASNTGEMAQRNASPSNCGPGFT